MVKMKKNIYTKTELKVCRLLVILFVVIYIFASIIVGATGTENLAKMLDISYTVRVLCICTVLLAPILIVILLYMCIERYLYFTFREEDTEVAKSKKYVYFSIALIIIIGKIMLEKLLAIPAYIMGNWNLLEGLHTCIVVKFVVALLWVLGWGYCIVRRDAISVKGGVKKKEWILCIIGMILLLGITELGEEFASKTAHRQWYQVLEEYNKNCDPTVDEYPSRN